MAAAKACPVAACRYLKPCPDHDPCPDYAALSKPKAPDLELTSGQEHFVKLLALALATGMVVGVLALAALCVVAVMKAAAGLAQVAG